MSFMPFAIGIVASVGVAIFAKWVGFDRRTFYPAVMIVIALYYVLFAVMSGSLEAVVAELVLMMVFTIAAVVGFKRSEWIVAAALAAHGVMDVFHGHLVENSGVPAWWPAWCLAYDVGAAVCLAVLIRSRSASSAGSRSHFIPSH